MSGVHEVVDTLKMDAFGTVEKVVNEDGDFFIRKTYRYAFSQDEIVEIKNEHDILVKLNHPSIIKFVSSCENENSYSIVMEYADGGDLSYIINLYKKSDALMPEDEILFYFIQILFAFKYIQDKKVMHRDIKPQNIFITHDKIVKVGDFGVSKILETIHQRCKTFTGTPHYMSPELKKCLKYTSRHYDYKSEIWSLGCVLYEMCALQQAFRPNSKARKYEPIPCQYSQDLRNLISSMLSVNANDRPSINAILLSSFIDSRINSRIINSKIFINPQKLKIVLFGDSNVGKTSIISRLIWNNNEHIETTSLINEKKILMNNLIFDLSVWDVTNDKHIRALHCMATSVFIIVYSVDDRNSFKNVIKHYNEIRKIVLYPIVVLCANKIDLTNKVVTTEEGSKKAEEMIAGYFEVSAKNENDVQIMFNEITKKILEKYEINKKLVERFNK